ncbi:hypothetical protein [Mycolicibacterium sp. CBMA 226]|uniref:hypothetical protein n=1 Tax=Mycolicibacterium sp. CBMA 226 TaxID=2606611 RepID=UPI0012DC85E7|nr:hypothetical protein [Mycolicibacterium sp. CBMA 226]MUL78805.1 hypothetical protein [Mycolicibacterium sp. CBMA 226]QGW61100.1 hypothetical protein ICEMyc226_00068 [Mycolicibacterium sp.]
MKAPLALLVAASLVAAAGCNKDSNTANGSATDAAGNAGRQDAAVSESSGGLKFTHNGESGVINIPARCVTLTRPNDPISGAVQITYDEQVFKSIGDRLYPNDDALHRLDKIDNYIFDLNPDGTVADMFIEYKDKDVSGGMNATWSVTGKTYSIQGPVAVVNSRQLQGPPNQVHDFPWQATVTCP